MTGRSFVVLLVVAALACLAGGDIVYTRDGDKHEGVVRREGETVFVETADGEVAISADEVLYISTTAPTDGPDGDGDGSQPVDWSGLVDDEPAGPPPPPPTSASSVTGRSVPPAQTFSAEEAARPESIVFMLMRQAAGTPRPGREILTEIERWQAAAHDRKRRALGQWLTPRDFALRRERFKELLIEARRTVERLRDVAGDDQDAIDARTALRTTLNGNLIQAANVWPDGAIGMFLAGIAHYQTGLYDKAIRAFELCRNGRPIVSAYEQGYGLALMRSGRKLDALAACLARLRLDPENRQALMHVYVANDSVPGDLAVLSDLVAQATELMAQYPDSAYDDELEDEWHKPGKRAWSTRTSTLPVPPYDRLEYRQGVAVPVGMRTLLVDKEVVRDAVATFILLDNGTVVPASVSIDESSHVSLAVVSTSEATFQPVGVSEDVQFRPGSDVAAYGLGIFTEMGTAPRHILGKITSAPAPPAEEDEDAEADEDTEAVEVALEVNTQLAAGEAASPVLTGDKWLVGFLVGRTNFRLDNGGEHELIPLADIAEIVKKAGRSSRGTTSKLKRQFEPIATEAATFVVYCISSETLD